MLSKEDKHYELKKSLGFLNLVADRGTDMEAVEEYISAMGKANQIGPELITCVWMYHNTFLNVLLENFTLTPIEEEGK